MTISRRSLLGRVAAALGVAATVPVALAAPPTPLIDADLARCIAANAGRDGAAFKTPDGWVWCARGECVPHGARCTLRWSAKHGFETREDVYDRSPVYHIEVTSTASGTLLGYDTGWVLDSGGEIPLRDVWKAARKFPPC